MEHSKERRVHLRLRGEQECSYCDNDAVVQVLPSGYFLCEKCDEAPHTSHPGSRTNPDDYRRASRGY